MQKIISQGPLLDRRTAQLLRVGSLECEKTSSRDPFSFPLPMDNNKKRRHLILRRRLFI